MNTGKVDPCAVVADGKIFVLSSSIAVDFTLLVITRKGCPSIILSDSLNAFDPESDKWMVLDDPPIEPDMGDSNELRALIREMSEQNAARVAQVEASYVQDLTRQLREFMSVMGGTNEKGMDTGISGSSSRLNTATGPEERLELRQTGGMVPSKIAAQKLGATLDSQSALQVAVANGEKTPSTGTCNETIQVSSEHFPVDLYVIPLDGFDVVLGVRWLMTLGPIWWNFSTLTMCFELGNRQVTLQGLQPEHRPRLQLLNEHQA
ncbi:hypothetical protein GH714_040313 [Hevea brasiliensis]|uniref:Uncharacterized protein n=1 Tax=Hevea brasiliensis TaxID=3981 RepID=A0A6A6MT74_HEVBR|nr:hypothetical protein GH714_040313 [Hevea brasiliensis]